MTKFIYTRLMVLTILLATTITANAQRKTDVLGRGLVVMKANTGNFLSWRRFGEEYYDTYYNVYRDGTKIATNLNVTNFSDTNGSDASSYTIRPVVLGVEQTACSAVTPWESYTPLKGYGNQNYPTGYLDITLQPVYSYNGVDVSSTYVPNDAEVADLDGDGEMEIIIKRISTDDDAALYVEMEDPHYNIFEAYELDGTRLWWIDAGPNMVSGSSTEFNIVAYDWDQDGKAEVLLRGADGMVIHHDGGTTTIGYYPDANYRSYITHTANMTYTNTGNEYLIYMNGETGTPYPIGDDAQYPFIEYPLTRESANAWGDSYGHRSSKYFMGAPFLDGLKPSIFLGRGIYTRHKMCALDVDPSTHKLTEIWRWECNDSESPWYGNGYHNYVVADVDEDGRDEIVYGSMVIDDNGKGLSTTGYEHGDAQHVGDFDPYRKGLEFFGCLEDGPFYGFNYRNATTSEVYYKHTGTRDDGRALADNFSNSYPGASGCSAGHTTMISCVADVASSDIPANGSHVLNFRLYWDDDLLSEAMGSKSSEGWVMIEGPNKGRIFTSDGNVHLNSGTKNVPCFQGDIIGDWREEIIVTNGTNIRIYSSGFPTDYTLPTLWHDHQYRQAMVWQMHAYNQPPHLSYFLGDLEGITVAPPPYTMTDRTEISNGGTISTTHDGKHIIACETNDMTISVTDGASPWVFTDNAPYWCQGTDENGTTGTKVETDGSIGVTDLPDINYTYYTHTVTGGAFTGAMHLAKQGQGTLVLPNVTETYTGETNIWAGTLEFDGTMESSPVWLNRFTTLNSTGGVFGSSISAEYGATIQPGGASTNISTISANELNLRFGSRVVFDLVGTSVGDNDQILVGTLSTESKVGEGTWDDYGPEYLQPVFQFNNASTLDDDYYPIGTLDALADGSSLDDIIIEGVDSSRNPYLLVEDGILYLVIGSVATLDDLEISITDWANYDLTATYPSSSSTTYFLPVVTASSSTAGVTPTFTGKFTDADGNVTNVGSNGTAIFTEDFEGSTTASDYWKNGNGGIFTPTYTNSDGQCIAIQSSEDRGDYTLIDADYTNVSQYTIEFDAYFNNASKTTDFAVMSASHASSWIYNWGYNWLTTSNYSHNAYLLHLARGEYSTTFTVNDGTETITLSNSTWYHFTLDVNVDEGTVAFNITQKGSSTSVGSGSYTLPSGESAYCDGLYIRNGRYNYSPGGAGIDNIVITPAATSVSTYTFEKPGTLSMKAKATGYRTAEATFVVDLPYVQDGSDYVPVNINDEKCTQFELLGEIDGGNSHLWRSGIENSSTWASFVLPYSMSAEQVKSVFGEGTVVANLMESAGDESTLMFETESGAIQANQPFLIKGVTNASPYLIKGVSGTPIDEPSVATSYYKFIGNYESKGEATFYIGDYFLTSDGLRQPSTDGITMTLNGYRGFFRSTSGSSQAPTIVFDDETKIQEIAHTTSKPSNVYNVTGQRVRTSSDNLKNLPRGIYIIEGKKITVK